MSADLFSNFIGMTLQATGNNNNAWGTILNGSALQTVERALCGNISHAVTGGTLDLSGTPPPAGVTAALDFVQIITGTLTSNQTIIVPNLSKTWFIINETTGAFSLLVEASGGTAIQIPQGSGKFVVCDGATNLYRLDKDSVGTFVYGAVVPNDALACSGQSLLQASYPDLFAKIGTTFGSVDGTHFTLPLLTDTGRFLRSTTGSLTVGTYQASQNKSHTHTGSGTTSTESNDHTHTGSGTTSAMSANASHSHVENIPNFGAGASWNNANGAANSGTFYSPLSTQATNTDHTHTYSFTTSGISAAHTHTYSFTTSTGSADGTEARPEALAVVISIRY